MDIIEVPFNSFIGIERVSQPSEVLLKLSNSPNYQNHLNTVHASAQFALAEACSGEYLLSRFNGNSSDYVPVVRRVEVKYKKPATGEIYAKAQVSDDEFQRFINALQAKSRAMLSISVDIVDSNNIITMSASIEWFVQKLKQ
ncbi:YiiD C-terminal domain-containing protein [Microcoleus sp. herbarium12]|uniref:YiiD C-terminal domain-containing protein n=1 Tax=Microcoleus sp. herbarium12 TaxID=3055437 RepID=UPI002FD23CDB